MNAHDSTKSPSAVLAEAVYKLSMASSLDSVTALVAQAARRLTGADGATFVLRDGALCYYVDENAISPLWKGKKFPLETCISGWSMEHKQVVLIRDIRLDKRIPQAAYRPTFVRSLCMVPIRVENPLGAIGIYWAREFSPNLDEIKMLQALASSSASTLENLKLKEEIANQSMARQTFTDCQREFESAIQSIAHDLRNPLATIRLFADLLREKVEGDPQVESYVDSILATTDRSAEQIRRMLTLYTLNHVEPKFESVNLTAIAMEVGEQLMARNGQSNIHFHVEPHLHGSADPYLIRLVLENLISNAFKYSSKQVKPVVRFGSADASGAEQTYFVRDNGVGFDATDGHKLFRPMVRLHADSEFPGTGLGLASVARIIKLHGGDLRAEGKRSKGATFSFSLPIKSLA